MNADDITVVIPAAGRVPEGLLPHANVACPAMIPVGGRPVIHWTLSYLRSLGLRKVVIAVARRGMFIEDFVDCAFGRDCDVKFVVPSRDGGVGLTICELLDSVDTAATLLVLGDTHFQFEDPRALTESSTPFVLTAPVTDSYRWCVARADADGYLAELHDKVPGLSEPLDALVGVYHFSDSRVLRRAARENVEAAARVGSRAEIAGILERVRAETPIRVSPAKTWLDCGNADMLARAHQHLLQARAFNELQIDLVLGTITKRSRNIEKFVDEINYLRLLPSDLRVLFPRVLAYSTEWSEPWVQLEYYGYPSLSDVFLFESVDPAIWERVFKHLHAILTDAFGRHRRPLPSGAVFEMYVTKTRRRLKTMRCSPELLALVKHEGPVHVNGTPLRNLNGLWPRIEDDVRRIAENVQGTVIHGDCCLSNILYDFRSRICKFIDPRGSFGAAGIYGDPHYDVAKLWHSIHGLYDFIVNDLFYVAAKGPHIEISIRATAWHEQLKRRFEQIFFQNDPTRRRDIQLITALLFASMPALHDDHPNRQLAMYVRALQLLDECYRETV